MGPGNYTVIIVNDACEVQGVVLCSAARAEGDRDELGREVLEEFCSWQTAFADEIIHAHNKIFDPLVRPVGTLRVAW